MSHAIALAGAGLRRAERSGVRARRVCRTLLVVDHAERGRTVRRRRRRWSQRPIARSSRCPRRGGTQHLSCSPPDWNWRWGTSTTHRKHAMTGVECARRSSVAIVPARCVGDERRRRAAPRGHGDGGGVAPPDARRACIESAAVRCRAGGVASGTSGDRPRRPESSDGRPRRRLRELDRTSAAVHRGARVERVVRPPRSGSRRSASVQRRSSAVRSSLRPRTRSSRPWSRHRHMPAGC